LPGIEILLTTRTWWMGQALILLLGRKTWVFFFVQILIFITI
jgi:hypothetical protein